jgi:hypothetical protein
VGEGPHLVWAALRRGRAAGITFDVIGPMSVLLAVNGLTNTGPGTPVMTATLEMQPIGSGDLARTPAALIPLTAHTFGGPDTFWTAPITFQPRGVCVRSGWSPGYR